MKQELNMRATAQLFKLDLQEMFEQWEHEKPLRVGLPHASAMLAADGDFCLRQLVLLAVEPQAASRPALQNWEYHTNAIYHNGWRLHEKYQRLLERYGKVVYYRGDLKYPELDLTHYDEPHHLYFSPDAVIEHCGEHMVVEIKGYKQEVFDKLDEQGAPPGAAHRQLNLYLYLLHLQHGLILVENKNTQRCKVWCVTYDHEMVQPQLERIFHFRTALHAVRRKRELPERQCATHQCSRAQRCPVRNACFTRT
ncbi:PD-(D/E)XK nuclease family protein [Dictyobacter kobayashii]|uniref:PD-(D/E)XK endonuclease-like domain-containing protein n=1 Tax=Dictyobacter kobayashii TaxID=2014872 RepID=A0A402AEL7_9CHLR|nr:PD-(D/E)XK nuclease family protein [Dictyobacter kobayashii]GCE17567.1 hypothetical protein KDK_13670 [Dictyobacter kobayashii]